MNNKFEYQLKGIYTEFLKNRILDQDFEIVTIAMTKMTNIILEKAKDSNEDSIKDFVKSYKDSTKNITLNSKLYDSIIFERLYINNYFYFEEFISKCFSTLYINFPKFLIVDEINIDYEDLFEQDDINFIRNRFIDKKVKSIMQSSNIYSIFKKFDSIFALKIKIDKDILNNLFIISQNRNIIVHNKGLVNSIYLMELRKYSIISDKEEGDYILSSLDINTVLKSQFEFIDQIIEKVMSTLIGDYKRIVEYHNEIKRK